MHQSIIVTPSPGAVFLRTSAAVAEMTPSEALRVADEIGRCARIALAAADGAALCRMIAGVAP